MRRGLAWSSVQSTAKVIIACPRGRYPEDWSNNMVDRQDDNFVTILASSLVSPSYFCTCIQNRNQTTGGKKAWDTGSLLALTLLFDFRRGVRSENGSGGANG